MKKNIVEESIMTPNEVKELSNKSLPQIYRNTFEINHLKTYEYVNEFYKDIPKWNERIYLYMNNIKSRPKCICINCDNNAYFVDLIVGYRKTCKTHKCVVGYNNHKDINSSDKILLAEEISEMKPCELLEREIIWKYPKTYLYIKEMYPDLEWEEALYSYRINDDAKILSNEEVVEIFKTRKSLQFDVFHLYYPKTALYIKNYYTMTDKWIEKLYLYTHNMEEPPKCLNCGKYSNFRNFYDGYSLCCGSSHCSALCKDVFVSNEILPSNKILEMNRYERHPNTLKSMYPKMFEYLNNLFPEIESFTEKLYLYAHEMKEPPKCQMDGCNNFAGFNTFEGGYNKFCSQLCARKHSGKMISVILMEKYDASNPMDIPWIREKLFKANEERFGGPSPFCSEEVRKKSEQTYLEKSGGLYTNCFQDPVIQEKIKQTNIDKMGVDNIFKLKEFQESVREKWTNGFATSQLEQNYQNFVENLGYEIIRDDRSVVVGIEIDIYIPSLKLGIEINGSYWHSLKQKDKEYHIRKWMDLHNNSIELISLWEDWDFDLGCQFIIDKIKGHDLSKYKELWFPDIPDNTWPLDLGMPSNMSNIKIQKHLCNHGGFECSDCGIIILSP